MEQPERRAHHHCDLHRRHRRAAARAGADADCAPLRIPLTETTMEKFVSVEQANMAFKTKQGSFIALKNINVSIREGEFVTLIGHSGCGKSTLLNMVAGLLQPTSGVLLCAGREIA